MSGTSDIMVTRWDSGEYYSTPFVVCFGHSSITSLQNKITVEVNNILINKVNFSIDKYGYLHPMMLPSSDLARLNLVYGKNSIKFTLNNEISIES